MNRLTKHYIILLLTIFVFSGCSNEPTDVNQKITHLASSNDTIKQNDVQEEEQEYEIEDFGETECVSVDQKNIKMNNFPFDIADKVVIHSFEPHNEEGYGLSSIRNNEFLLNGIDETKELTDKEIKELYTVLYSTKTKRKGNISEAMDCYNPHHSIVFFSKDNPIEFIEICIECEDYKTYKRTRIDFCDEKWCKVYDYFQTIGLNKKTPYLTRKCEK